MPTLRESGLADFEATTATGLLAPAATPKAVVDVLNAALAKVLADEQVKSRMLAVGSVAHGVNRLRHDAPFRLDVPAPRV